MRRRIAFVLVTVFCAGTLVNLASADPSAVSANATAYEAKVKPRFTDGIKAKVPAAAKTLAKRLADDTKNAKPIELHAKEVAASLGFVPSGDIAELAFVILMETTRDAQEDVRAVMEEIKAINDAKSAQRAALEAKQKAAQERLTKLRKIVEAIAARQAGG